MDIKNDTDRLLLPIEVLDLDLRTSRTLRRGNVSTLSDIINFGESGLAQIYQLGIKKVPYVLDKLNDFLTRTEGKTLAELQNEISQESHKPLLIETNTDILSLPIEVLDLDLRTQRTLNRGNVSTLFDIVNLGENGLAQIYQLGIKRVPDVVSKLNDFLTRTKGKTLAELQPKTQKPFLYEATTSEKPNLIQELVPFIKALVKELKFQNDYEILKRRYGLENSKNYTLQEVGDYFGISRERVRQIEARAKEIIKQTLTATFSTAKWEIPHTIIEEANFLFSLLQNYDVLITEDEALKIMQNRYGNSVTKSEMGSIRFLMSLAGLEALPKATRETIGIALIPSWALLEKVDKSLLFKVIDTVYHLLLEEIKPVSKFDIFIKINGKLKKKVDSVYLEYATKICTDIQQVDDETYEFRFQSLPSVADKAYMVLYKANKPLHNRDILREVNRLQVTAGEHDVHDRTLKGQLASDKRFEAIGKSGEWSLIEWEHIAKETILELMQEYFHLKQTPASAKEIFNYVKSKRESVKLTSIHTYLIEKSLFTRVANGKYGLSAWGLEPLPFERLDSIEMDAQIDDAIKAVFTDKHLDKIPLWNVVEEVSKRTGRSVLTVRKRISELPYLDFEPHPTYPQRKYLKLLKDGQYRTVSAKADTKRTLIRDNIQKEIETYLLQQTGNSAPLSVIATYVMKKTGCIKPTFYHYLDEMENVKKSKDGSVVVCKLITANTTLDFPQIEVVADNELKDNLKRAINNFNIDNIDLGLFQLGKIFENELRLYLTQAKAKNVFQVTSKDLERLVDMINCLERNKVITEKHHLTLLREHRNERAHGDIPNFDERQKLIKHAPFLGDMYIKYIVLLNEKRQKL